MNYEGWVERWQQSQLDDYLLEVYGTEDEEELENEEI